MKTKIGKTETDIDKVALLIEALEKVEDANTLTPQQSSKLAYLRQKETALRQKETDLRQEKTDLRQEKTALLQKEARLEALAASTGSKASADPGKTSARGASRYEQRFQLISRVRAREECGL